MAHADIDPVSGIDFVTVGAVGNEAYPGGGVYQPPQDRAVGRGQVTYEYRIGKFEVTTSQWVEFFNAALDRPAGDAIPHVFLFGDQLQAMPATPQNPGGRRWTVPAGNEMLPVGDITWRTAAIYCNWLCNGKATNREAFLTGAYDVSTFGWTGEFGDIFTDQQQHTPGAAYWIPTWDEWLKAAHYDPNKLGPGQAGWWQYSYMTDVQQQPGLPGQGWGNWNPRPNGYSIPLGAYSTVMSPWGLFDTAGATTEWMETVYELTGGERFRYHDGSDFDGSGVRDNIGIVSADYPHIPDTTFGLRIAAAVPSPATAALAVIVVPLITLRCRRRM
ncbi:MAG: SUMF1/EgtB/PvdO family nonheme iron enzyme [Phycisphaerales bacterium]